jgi:hypothetical protein
LGQSPRFRSGPNDRGTAIDRLGDGLTPCRRQKISRARANGVCDTFGMTKAPSPERSALIDWNRIELWSQQLAQGNTSAISAAYEAHGARWLHTQWCPLSMQLPAWQLQYVNDYWLALRNRSGLPSAADIDFDHLEAILGYVMMIDVVDGGKDFFYRRNGPVLSAVAGVDMSEKLLSQHTASLHVVEGLFAVYRAVIARREPVYIERAPSIATITERWQYLVLPLSDDRAAVSSFLVCVVPVNSSGLPLYMTYGR